MNADTRYGLLSAVLLALAASGCHQPLAVANPLQDLASWAGPVDRAEIARPLIRNTHDGLTVVGTRGDALNAATRLHQLLLRAQVPNEVVCEMKAAGPAARSELRITFPGTLTPQQREVIVKTLAGFDGPPRG